MFIDSRSTPFKHGQEDFCDINCTGKKGKEVILTWHGLSRNLSRCGWTRRSARISSSRSKPPRQGSLRRASSCRYGMEKPVSLLVDLWSRLPRPLPQERCMRVRVLGSGAGGGFPQWNCNCDNCRGFRSGSLRATARTQSSIALSADGTRWYLINASPDIRQQINAFDGLFPDRTPRGTPIQALLLTNADIDHIAGLLSLRESQPLCLYSTQQVQKWVLESNAVFRVLCLSPTQCTWKTVSTSGQHELIGVDGKDSGLRYQAFAVPSKPPAYLVGLVSQWNEETVGYKITDAYSGRSLAYVPGIKQLDAA